MLMSIRFSNSRKMQLFLEKCEEDRLAEHSPDHSSTPAQAHRLQREQEQSSDQTQEIQRGKYQHFHSFATLASRTTAAHSAPE